jgi:hypothetical protein
MMILDRVSIRRAAVAHPRAALSAGLAMTGIGWALMWGPVWRLNPLSFTLLWTGAAVTMWALSRDRYPGVRRHLFLAAISVPVWWWFELVNERVQNWEYAYAFQYGQVQWAFLSSLAFSTVVPAILSAIALVGTVVRNGAISPPDGKRKRFARRELALAAVLQSAVFAFPVELYPFVWVAPFLAVDGVVGLMGGQTLGSGFTEGRWRDLVVIGAAGLLCGVLWEFWNYYATPKWVYHIPLLGFGKVFEMPVLGYTGYIPFAWSIVQLVRLSDLVAARVARR